MSHYNFASQFRSLYDKAVDRYAAGTRGAETYFDASERAFLAANGITAQHLYDYAEDQIGYDGEPGYDRALAIELVRRDYFLNAQRGKASTQVLDEASLPAKTAELRGITWLPRILPKARAKLRGELPPSIMYSCGGDRQFLKRLDIFPSEFLTLLWRNENNEAAVVEWVVQRSQAK